jgi:hypothetical protein
MGGLLLLVLSSPAAGCCCPGGDVVAEAEEEQCRYTEHNDGEARARENDVDDDARSVPAEKAANADGVARAAAEAARKTGRKSGVDERRSISSAETF